MSEGGAAVQFKYSYWTKFNDEAWNGPSGIEGFFSSKYLTIDAECAAPLRTLASSHRNLRSASLTGEHDFSLWNSLFKWIFQSAFSSCHFA